MPQETPAIAILAQLIMMKTAAGRNRRTGLASDEVLRKLSRAHLAKDPSKCSTSPSPTQS